MQEVFFSASNSATIIVLGEDIKGGVHDIMYVLFVFMCFLLFLKAFELGVYVFKNR